MKIILRFPEHKTTTSTIETVPTTQTTLNNFIFNSRKNNKLRLPIIPMPQWGSFKDWIRFQDPAYATKNKGRIFDETFYMNINKAL